MEPVTNKKLAWFKRTPISSFLQRPGAVQCVRKCNNCIRDDDNSMVIKGKDDLTNIQCFDNLVLREKLWLSRYQSIQYHLGQIDILKQAISSSPPSPVIFIVASNRPSDIEFLQRVLKQANLSRKFRQLSRQQMEESANFVETFINNEDFVAISIELKSCETSRISNKERNIFFSPKQLESFLSRIIGHVNSSANHHANNFNPILVPVGITKDHEQLLALAFGATCIQILEPFSARAYIDKLETMFPSTHLTQHIYFDIMLSSIVLPSHLVAFILCNLSRYNGISHEDLVYYMDWIRKSAIDLNIQLGFTGSTDHAIQFGLKVLENYVRINHVGNYSITNENSLKIYANLVAPAFAFYGLVSRAILMEHNRTLPETDDFLTDFSSFTRIRVVREKVFETVEELAEIIERKITCRRPCVTHESRTCSILDSMITWGAYFTIEEPKIKPAHTRQGWAGDYDDDTDDEEYFERNKDKPAFQTWIVVTTNEKKLEQLNFFMNTIEPYIY